MATTKKAAPKKTDTVLDPTKLDIRVDESVTILSAFKLGRGHDIGVVSLSAYNGNKALDFRRFYGDDEDSYHPTAKGMRIPIDSAPAVVALLVDQMDKIKAFAKE